MIHAKVMLNKLQLITLVTIEKIKEKKYAIMRFAKEKFQNTIVLCSVALQ